MLNVDSCISFDFTFNTNVDSCTSSTQTHYIKVPTFATGAHYSRMMHHRELDISLHHHEQMAMIKIDSLLPKGNNVHFCTTAESIQKCVTGRLHGRLPFKAYNIFSYDASTGVFTADSYVAGDNKRCAEINNRFKLWDKREADVLLRTSLKFYSPVELQGRRAYIAPRRYSRCKVRSREETVNIALISIDTFNEAIQTEVWYVLLHYPKDGHRSHFVLGHSLLHIQGLTKTVLPVSRQDYHQYQPNHGRPKHKKGHRVKDAEVSVLGSTSEQSTEN